MTIRRRRIEILVGLFFAFVVAELGLTHYAQKAFGTLVGRELPWWVLVAVMLAYIAFVERKPMSSIGLRKPNLASIIWGVVGGLVLFLGALAIYTLVFPAFGLHLNDKAAAAIFQTPTVYRMALVLRAAVAEEILYRGYPIERIDELTGSRAVAAAISWAVFTCAHLGYWGWAQLLVAGFGGLILTALYLWRRDLLSNMLAHLIGDGIPFVVLPALS